MDSTSRSGLIPYAKHNGVIYALLGCNREDLTSLGGRTKHHSEDAIRRLVREVYEETKGLLDYTKCPGLLLTGDIIIEDRCYYVFLQVDYSVLVRVYEEFAITTPLSERSDHNEMTNLRLVPVDELILSIVIGGKIKCTSTFKSMFRRVGYDTITQNKRNYLTETLNVDVDINPHIGIADFPKYVSVNPSPKGLPCVYGTLVQDNHLYDHEHDLVVKRKTTTYLGPALFYAKDGVVLFDTGLQVLEDTNHA